ncbi:unnamed protein product [Cuscuta campestris]|uniref:RNase H type-1 domain-containing protein n=1 Tax=Cuscuta campestris TaxID=132261 RepID=A0A484L9W7_9ASTE|nr:unnamed protein product [Cuscuta campestris]
MARFWWGGGNRHHWISWEKLCFPKEEGGLGIRDLKSLEDSFSLKLWWKFHQDNGLWARLMRSKYWREGDIWEALTDSPVWKRISRIDEIASNACAVNEDGSMVWSLEANGSFSLKSAFDFCRPSSPIVASFKYLWMKPQNPKIEEVWKHFSACLGFLHRFSSSINQHFMDWWLRGNCNNIYGFLRMHLPGIICWHIWKELNAIIHEGKTDFSSRTLNDSISMFVRQWLAAKIPKKLKGADAWLNEKKLLPFFPKAHKIRVVKWLAPPKGRLKLNIDASFTSGSKRGAVILRDDEGRFVRASSFSVSGSSPYQAELDASIKGIKWALNFHYLLVYETDALEILKRIGYYTYYTHSPFPIDTLAKLIHENDVWRSHTLREAPFGLKY